MSRLCHLSLAVSNFGDGSRVCAGGAGSLVLEGLVDGLPIVLGLFFVQRWIARGLIRDNAPSSMPCGKGYAADAPRQDSSAELCVAVERRDDADGHG